jgi:hypothetical protein
MKPHLAPRLTDTSPEARAEWIRLLRQMTPQEKMLRLEDLNRTGREMVRAGLRRRHPDASEEELRRRFIALMLEPDLVLKAYGFDPREEGYACKSRLS